MRWLKLTVTYDGGRYAGWQVQPQESTVQEVLETAWQSITQETVRVTVAGRTDAGVHAIGQVVAVGTTSLLSNGELKRGLNAKLPDDVAIIAIDDAPRHFHATRDAISKLYRYQIHNSRIPTVFDRQFTWHVPRPLDAETMHRAGQALVGRHDFSSFESSGSPRPDPVRTLFRLNVTRGSAALCDRITIEVEGDGFLYNMVRSIVGTLVPIGQGNRPSEWAAEVLAAHDRRHAGQTAPPHGLFLVHVRY
jgi:tRNA pseudouridine38-40 synthase